ncbi:MAG: GNAT family N-acetyltransferase [Pirellulales bacterium]|nr:GNAT family N-acetyltransferase [Pirellulales bacterium]
MATETPLGRPVPLEKGHVPSRFDCGVESLNDYLQKHAYANHQNRSARTYVAARGARVVGYYTLAAGSVRREETPQRIAHGLGQYPVPVVLLARLGVDLTEQGHGLGGALLKDAILRAVQAADIIGSRAILTHAIDENARAFHSRFGFEPSPVQELHLYLLVKDVKRTLSAEVDE